MSVSFCTARIRWQVDRDPAWEVETSHGGFATPEDAALFANGFSERGADQLRLESGRLVLTLTDSTEVELAGDAFEVWRLVGDDGSDYRVADDVDFERLSLNLSELSAKGLDGGLVQIKYGVTYPSGEPVDVVLNLDETGMLTVTVQGSSPVSDGSEDASFELGIIPQG